MHLNIFCIILISFEQHASGQTIDGCPMYGCRPSGTFSFTFYAPRINASVGWVADFFVGPVPGELLNLSVCNLTSSVKTCMLTFTYLDMVI